MDKYMLYNTATETLEKYELMDAGEAQDRNDDLRADNDERRWLPVLNDDPDEDYAKLDYDRA